MKGRKGFLIIDFLLQTFLVGITIFLIVIGPTDNYYIDDSLRYLIPMLPIWLIVSSTFEKIKYEKDLRFKINRFWVIIFLIGLVFYIEKIQVLDFVVLTFMVFSWLLVLANYIIVIYEYFQLMKAPKAIEHFENILDDNDF